MQKRVRESYKKQAAQQHWVVLDGAARKTSLPKTSSAP
jgi:hypothetical protein